MSSQNQRPLWKKSRFPHEHFHRWRWPLCKLGQSTTAIGVCAKLFNGFVISNPSGRFQFCPLLTSGLSLPASGGGVLSIGQVGEWLKPTDCKSVPPCEVRRFESFPVHHAPRWFIVIRRAVVAQMVERVLGKDEVTSSILVNGSTSGGGL